MGACSDQLLREYEIQQEQIRQADEVILYGKTVVYPVIKAALDALKINALHKLFDGGCFANGEIFDPNLRRVVILCGMREKTRKKMRIDSAVFFPETPCFDYLAIYYNWLLNYVKRDCDPEQIAETLLAVRAERTIHNIDSINTSFCNLNCKECSNGMPYRKNKKRISVDRHIQSLNQLTRELPISYCNIQGGEPLLDRDLPERIRLHAKNPRIAFLTLATNGTILPSDEVMEAMRDAGLMLRISDYGALSKRKLLLMEKAEAFSVPCDIYHRSKFWVSYGKLEERGRTPAENRAVSENCHFGTKDLMLYDRFLFCCCRTLFADAVGLENDAVIANRLDLSKQFSREALMTIVSGGLLYRMCDFCDYPMKIIGVAEQLHRP